MSVEKELQERIYKLEGVIQAQTENLNSWRKEYDHAIGVIARMRGITLDLEDRIRIYVEETYGKEFMHPKERTLRVLEETVELVQAEEITREVCLDMVNHVYDRPCGNRWREAGGVAFTMMAWCASAGIRFIDLVLSEFHRNEDKTKEDIQKSIARKAAAGLGMAKGGNNVRSEFTIDQST